MRWPPPKRVLIHVQVQTGVFDAQFLSGVKNPSIQRWIDHPGTAPQRVFDANCGLDRSVHVLKLDVTGNESHGDAPFMTL